jgi:hypothetical protein
MLTILPPAGISPISAFRRSGPRIALKTRGFRASWTRIAGGVAAMLCLASLPDSAFAQVTSDLAQDVNPLFQRLLANPGNLDNTLKYGSALLQTDDTETAISTYEQLLFYNPALSRVRFELGILYYRLGSYAMARGYFQSALAMQDITPQMQEQAEEYVAAIDKKLQPDQFSGFAQTGLRYQTNAAAGPGSQVALASGFTLNNSFLARPDWNWFGAFGVNYVHDFQDQRGDTFEASAVGYDAQQFTQHQFDVGLLELRAGPRFGLDPESTNGLSFKPYVVATGALLADAPFNGGIGGGATVHANLGSVALDPFVEVLQESYRNSALYPLATELAGPLSTVAFQAAGPVANGLSWQARLSYIHSNAVFEPYAYNRYSADIWLPWNFKLPGDSRVWTITPNFGISDWLYKAPDPTIDTTTAQRDLEWRVGLGLDVPIYRQFSLGLLVQYHVFASNIPVFSFRDLAVTAGPTIKF